MLLYMSLIGPTLRFFLNMVNDMYFSVAQVCLIDCSILLIYFGYIFFYKYRLMYLIKL